MTFLIGLLFDILFNLTLTYIQTPEEKAELEAYHAEYLKEHNEYFGEPLAIFTGKVKSGPVEVQQPGDFQFQKQAQ